MDVKKYGNLIIDRLEGGYFHPDMYKKDPGFFAGRGDKYNATIDKAYKNSGETMFGFDRKAGGNLNKTATMVEFWKLVDQYYKTHHADLTWWGEKGGKFRTGKASGVPASVGTRLRELAIATMQKQLDSLANSYLKPEAKKIVFSDPRLFVQFLYACWNGSGNFKKFADVMNAAYAKGTRDPDKLETLIQAKRVEIFGTKNTVQAKLVPQLIAEVAPSGSNKGMLLLFAALAVGAAFLIFKK